MKKKLEKLILKLKRRERIYKKASLDGCLAAFYRSRYEGIYIGTRFAIEDLQSLLKNKTKQTQAP